MDTIEKIIERRLQDEIKVTMQRYQSGEIRREAEKEFREKQRKEKISNIARLPKASGLKNKLYVFWLRLSNNKAYYDAVSKVGGKKACRVIKEEISEILQLVSALVWFVVSLIVGKSFVAHEVPPIPFTSLSIFGWAPAIFSLVLLLFFTTIKWVKKSLYVLSALSWGWGMYLMLSIVDPSSATLRYILDTSCRLFLLGILEAFTGLLFVALCMLCTPSCD